MIVFSAAQGGGKIVGNFYSSVSPPTSSFLVKEEALFVSLLLVFNVLFFVGTCICVVKWHGLVCYQFVAEYV